MSSPCENCHAGCCRAFVVPITGSDVLRIEKTGLTFWDFAVRWSDPDGQIARRLAPQLYFADAGDEPFVLGLMHTASETLPGSGRCRFLRETTPTEDTPLGRGECGLYEHRPATCRVFPAKFDSGRELVQLEPIAQNGRPADPHPAYSMCPREWTARDLDAVETPAAIATAEHEMTFFHKVAALWNRRRGDWVDFPPFLRLVYGARLRGVGDSAGDSRADDTTPATIPFVRPATSDRLAA